MDYTMAQYRPETFEVLAYNLTVNQLVEKLGYPKVCPRTCMLRCDFVPLIAQYSTGVRLELCLIHPDLFFQAAIFTNIQIFHPVVCTQYLCCISTAPVGRYQAT